MAKEIERKFLIDLKKIGALEKGASIKQGYITTKDKTVVRVRVSGAKAYLTLKGANQGISRLEFEYEIPVTDANEIIRELCSGPVVEKTRYLIEHEKKLWEVDVFHGDNEGLVVAEVELNSEDENINLPGWVEEEVTGEAKYYNSNLLSNPFKNWK